MLPHNSHAFQKIFWKILTNNNYTIYNILAKNNSGTVVKELNFHIGKKLCDPFSWISSI